MSLPADATLVPPGQRVLVAVSSGADSLALLCWLLDFHSAIVVGHINHALHELRPGQCQADEDFVRARCAALGVPFVAATLDLPRHNGHTNENVARQARYLALARQAQQQHCAVVATAHTATDGLETALINLMRGGGPNGWLGARPHRVLEGEIALVRPFWRVGRAAVRDWLRARGWDWREDASNHDPVFARNRVRAEVLPLLSAISQRPPDVLAQGHARGAAIARDESDFLERLAWGELSQLILRREPQLLTLEADGFRALDAALQRRVLRRAAREIAPELRDLSAAKVETVLLCVAQSARRTVWSWPHGVRVEWTGLERGNRVRLWRVEKGPIPALPPPVRL